MWPEDDIHAPFTPYASRARRFTWFKLYRLLWVLAATPAFWPRASSSLDDAAADLVDDPDTTDSPRCWLGIAAHYHPEASVLHDALRHMSGAIWVDTEDRA